MAGCFTGETSAQYGQQRGKTYTAFYHNSVRICKKTFLFLHCMSDKHFKSIKSSYFANGLVARVHGNKGSRRMTGLSLKEKREVVPGYKDTDVKLLPSRTTNHAIWDLYLQAATDSRLHEDSGILHLHTALATAPPNIMVMKPMSGLPAKQHCHHSHCKSS